MLKWALIFFFISIVTGILGLYGIAGLTMDLAKILFWGFLIIAAILTAVGLWGARKISRLTQ